MEMRDIGKLLPGALVFVFAWKLGNFPGAASFAGAAAAHLLLAGLLLAAAFLPWRRAEPISIAALLAAVAASWLLSPSGRAGETALLLVPAFGILPRLGAALAGPPGAGRDARGGDARGRDARLPAAAGLAAALLALASQSLWGVFFLDTPGASLPLGHHNLLAALLVLLLPFCWPLWAAGGRWRLLGGAAAAAGLAALFATGSLAAWAGLAAAATLLLARRRPWLYLLFPLALLVQAPRVALVLAGEDPSSAARLAYLEAAWRGFLARPLLGWGPGSTPWQLALFFEPRPGVHPPDHLVPDAHDLPLNLLFELGLVGVVALAGVLLWHWRQLDDAAKPWGQAGRVALGAFLLASLGGLPLAVFALPLAFALVLGVARRPAADAEGRRSGWLAAAALVWVALGAFWLVPRDRAMARWERGEVEAAAALDPAFPLYRLPAAGAPPTPALAAQARDAARAAGGVSFLWLEAGRLGVATGAGGSREALERACDLNVFGALAPWQLALAEPALGTEAERAGWLARALLSEPRLIAARGLHGHPALVEAALGRLEGAVEIGWLGRLREAWRASFQDGPAARLTLELDREAGESASLHLFRRQPRPRPLIALELQLDAVPELQAAFNSQMVGEATSFYREPGCTGPSGPRSRRP